MTSIKQWDIVIVPFPYTDRTTTKRRPALVVSNDEFRENHSLVWVVMITSANNARWVGDIEIEDFRKVGLPAPSIIRTAKITTIDADLVMGKLGMIGKVVKDEIKKRLTETIT